MAACTAQAGAFLEAPGEGQVITSMTFSGSTRAFNSAGKVVPVASYRKFELGTYIEYGATDWLTLVASPSMDRIESSPSLGRTQSTTGVGDTGLGARARIYQTQNIIVSVQGLFRPPLDLQTDPATGALHQSHAPTGEVRALLGINTTILSYDSFADIEAGYRWNDVATANERQLDFTLGLHATPLCLVLLQNFLVISDGRTLSNPSYAWNKEQVSGVYTFNSAWSGQIGAFVTVAGRNAGREIGPQAALWYRF